MNIFSWLKPKKSKKEELLDFMDFVERKSEIMLSPLAEFLTYKDDWDGYGAKKPTLEMLEYYYEFYKKLKTHHYKNYLRSISLTNGLTASFDLDSRKDYKLTIDLYPSPDEEDNNAIGNYCWWDRRIRDAKQDGNFYTQEEILKIVEEFNESYL